MDNERTTFTVIIPTYNRLKFLEKAVWSVLHQTYPHFELIIVDDGSTDQTREFISTINDRRIRYIFQENKGPASARNRGISSSSYPWIAFLDSDDWWHKDKLVVTAKYIHTHPEYKIFHTEEIWYRNGKILNQKKKHKKPTGWVFENCLPLCCISISTAVIHKHVFETVGLFDETLPACEDYDLWLRITQRFSVFLISERLTYKDGGRPDQVSQKIPALDRFRIKSLVKLLYTDKISDSTLKEKLVQELKRKCQIYISGCIKRGKSSEAEEYTRLLERYISFS